MPPTPFKPLSVTTPDGVTINAQEWGNPQGREIVFIHGFMQCHLSWVRQYTSALADEFRLITLDLRGHGGSDKRMEPALYGSSALFGDELRAVLDAAGLKAPVLVGWSFGTRVVCDYLMKHGQGRIAGINFAGSSLSDDLNHFGPGRAHIGQTFAADYATTIAATRSFLRACFAIQPAQDEFEIMLAFNAGVPPKIRGWLRRGGDVSAVLQSLKMPVLVTHGVDDQITSISLGRWVAAMVPGSTASFYDGVGHAPFYEAADRFNGELAAFVRGIGVN